MPAVPIGSTPSCLAHAAQRMAAEGSVSEDPSPPSVRAYLSSPDEEADQAVKGSFVCARATGMIRPCDVRIMKRMPRD